MKNLRPASPEPAATPWLDRFRSWLPGNCLLCGFSFSGPVSLCPDCEARLPVIGQACVHCGIRLQVNPAGARCGQCMLRPPPFNLCRGAFAYDFPVRNLITDFKFRASFASGRILACKLAETITAYYGDTENRNDDISAPQLLVPVPLFHTRLRERGFNQALLLARLISQYTGIPVAADLLVKTRETPPQSKLDARHRKANLSRVFRVEAIRTSEKIQHVAVIDDVVTTAATACAVTNTLLAGFKDRKGFRVDVWAAARA